MKLEIKKDREEIRKIIENTLPLMNRNKLKIQECANCIIYYFIEKTAQNNSNLTKKTNSSIKSTAQKEISPDKTNLPEEALR